MDAGALTADEAAELAGIGRSTWDAYVSRGQAPAAAAFDPQTGRRVWDRSVVIHWIEHRPGRGARTDLGPKPV